MEVNGNGALVMETERLVYYETVPKLSTMASVKIALDLWHTHVTQTEFIQNVVTLAVKDDITDFYIVDIQAASYDSLNEALKPLQLPNCTKESIKSSLYRIHVQMTRYISTLHHRIFGGNLRDHRIESFQPRWWVWCGNGEINRKKTALNILSEPELSEVQKFVFMCAYRVVDDVSMIRIPSNLASIVENLTLEDNPTVVGFVLYLKKELHRFSVFNDFDSLDTILATLCLKDNHSWFEYFWDRLGFEDQTMVAESMLITHASSQFQKRLMSMMNWSQQSVLLQRIPYDLVLNFWIDDAPESAFEVWMRVKNEFTVDQFSRLVIVIFKTRLSSENDMKLLIDVWSTADDHLKYNFSEVEGIDVPVMFFNLNAHSMVTNNDTESPAPSSLGFIYQFLLTKSADYRRKMMLKIKDKLALCYSNSLLMGNILRLCWPDANELSKFKKSVFNSYFALFYGADLINELQFAKLSLMMMIHSPNENATRDFVKMLLLTSNWGVDKSKFMFCLSKWIDLCGFIDKIWNEDAHSSLKIKKQFVSSFAVECSYRWNIDQNCDEFVKIVTPMLMPEQSLPIEEFFSNRRCLPKATVVEEMRFFSYLSWCLDGDTNADDLRKLFNGQDRGYKWIYLIIVLVSIFL